MKEKTEVYHAFADRLLEASRILIFPHVHMDGDAIGSSAALCLALRKTGRQAYILTSEPTPANLDFLENGCVTRDPEIFPEGPDLAVMVDCSTMNRIPGRENAFHRAAAHAVIDHHAVAGDRPAFDFSLIDPASAACGELIWLILREMGTEIDRPVAEALFAAITTDTGNFQHSNTTRRTHEIAACLYDTPGFDSKPVSSRIYDRNSFELLRLEAMMVDQIHLYHAGQIGISRVTQEMLAQTGCRMDETDSFVQKVMSIGGIEIAGMLKQNEKGEVRISLRARSYANVAAVAVQMGGGGHVRAAGATFRGTVDEAEKVLSELLIRELETHGNA